jgi:hypothetical protein
VREVVSHLAAERLFKRLAEPLGQVLRSCGDCDPSALAFVVLHNSPERIIQGRAISLVLEQTLYLDEMIGQESAIKMDEASGD